MSCISRIQEFAPTFTASENQIADYIRSHISNTLDMTAGELAESCGVSPATVIRFSRSLGYAGYSEMKMDLARDTDLPYQHEIDELIHSNDSMMDIVKKYSSYTERTISNTMDLIKIGDLESAIRILLHAEKIYIFGIGASGLVAEDLQQKLVRINRPCVYYHDSNLGVASATHMTPKDAMLAFSFSGRTKEVNIPAEYARKKGVPVISVTKCAKSRLASLSDICLYIPNAESEIRVGAFQSRTSQLLISDLLYMGIIRKQLDKVDEYVKQSRELINMLKDQ